MSTSLDPSSQRRWFLRIALVVVLLALVLAGSELEFSRNNATARSATTSSTTVTTTGQLGSTTTTTTTPSPPTTLAPSPPLVSNPLVLNERSHGCGFAMKPNSTATSTPDVAVPIRPIGHCTMLEIGDSMGSDLGWGLARELTSTHALKLVQMDKSSSGLAASWFYDWPRHLKYMLAKHHPDLVLVCIGGDDEQGIRYDGRSYNFNTPQWRARYASLVRQIDTTATKAGSYVLWVGLPIMAPALYRAGVVAINSIYRSVAVTVPGVTYLSSWSLFADAQGRYRAGAPVNHVLSALRASDGFHFSVVGENVFATFVAQEMAAIYRVHLKLAQPAFITP